MTSHVPVQCILYKWRQEWGLPSLTAACIQVEAYLRFAEVEFVACECVSASASPTGQLPAVESQVELVSADVGATAADDFRASRAVIQQLKTHKNLDVDLSPQQKAELLAFTTLVETKLQPAILYCTWCERDSYSRHTRAAYGKGLPFPLSFYLPWSQQRCVQRTFEGVDIAKMYTDATEALEALASRLSSALERGSFFLGSVPSSLDAVLFASLSFIRGAPVIHPQLRQELESHRSLLKYIETIASQYFTHAILRSSPDEGAQWSQFGRGPTGQPNERCSRAQSAQSSELHKKGRIWLVCAAAAVAAYVVLGGQYIQFDFMGEEFEEEEEEY